MDTARRASATFHHWRSSKKRHASCVIFMTGIAKASALTPFPEINAMGSVPHRSAQWTRNSVRHILRNPTFKGMVAWNRVKHYRPGKGPAKNHDKNYVVYQPENDWILVPGLHQAIITEQQWAQAQAIRTSRYIPSQNTGHVVNPLAGLLICGRCGRNMQRMGNNKGAPYYLCNTRGCVAGAKCEYVYPAVIAAMQDRLAALRLEASSKSGADTSADEAMAAAYAKEIAKLDARIPRLHEFLEDGTYDRQTFRDRLSSINAQKNSLLEKQAELQDRIALKRGADLNRAANALENVLSLLPTLPPEEQNKLLKSVIKKITYFKEKKTKPRDFSLVFEARDFIW